MNLIKPIEPLPNSEKYVEAREGLPADLQPIFDQLVAEYRFLVFQHYRAPFVSYKVLADLVRNGWRLSAEVRTDLPERK